mmetsp:Transcript_3891/g.8380  ORF Transcript_3891/g.8380 Transcript_3891/m.8380 type:complete len:160 (+) Transcript_3891:112-591(+)
MMRWLLVLVVLSLAASAALAAPEWEQSVIDAFNIVDSDPETFKTKWADDCDFKVCFSGTPGCSHGTYDEVFQPFVDALKVYRQKKINSWSGSDSNSSIVNLSAYLETKNGCKALYTATVYSEVNDEGKVIRHYSYSDDSEELMKCVAGYFESLENKQEL